MRRRAHLANPYASRIDADEDRGASQYLLAGAVAAGVVVGGVLALSGLAAAEGATPGAVSQDDADDPDGTGPRSPAPPTLDGDASPDAEAGAGPVTLAEAQRWERARNALGERFSTGVDERVSAIRTALRAPALPRGAAEEIEAARESFRLSMDGIRDLASSLARTAVGVDAPPAGTSDVASATEAGPQLLLSPAFRGGEAPDGRTEGRELLDRGAGWISRMMGDARAYLDDVLDPIEERLGIPDGPVGAGYAAAVAPVGSAVRR